MSRKIIIDGIKIEGDEAHQIIHEAMHDTDDTGARRRIIPLGYLVLVAFAVGGATGLMGYILSHYAGGVPTPLYLGSCILVCFFVIAICSRFYWRSQRRQLRAAMRRRGFDLCPGCGYWLKGLPRGKTLCPECGAKRV
ncbi:MAG: hypothetical protein AAGB51_03805 [Planctomycetota bacterium]